VVGGVITGAFLFNLLHLSADRPLMDSVRVSMERQLQAGDIVYTNLDYGISPLSFYLSAKIDGKTSPENAINLSINGTLTYVYCNVDALRDFELPELLTSFHNVKDGDCFFVTIPRMQPSH